MTYYLTPYSRRPMESQDPLTNLVRLAIENPEPVIKVGLAIVAIGVLGLFLGELFRS